MHLHHVQRQAGKELQPASLINHLHNTKTEPERHQL
jgi:hypothetical protein